MGVCSEAKDELTELVEFLTAPQPHVRLQAVEIVNGVAASDSGPQQLAKVANQLIPPLMRMLGGREEEAKAASSAMVNLSPHPVHAGHMLEMGVIGRIMENLREPHCPFREAMAMIMSNVTRHTPGAMKLLQVKDDGVEGLYLGHLVQFIANSERASEQQRRELRHLGNAMLNVSLLPEGRDMLLAPGTGYLMQLLPQLKSKCVERRIAVATMLKNCCMDKSIGVEKLFAEGGTQLLSTMLLPLSGIQPREHCVEVRQALAEAVQLLAGTELGFDKLWTAGAPELLRAGYTDEEASGVCEAMEATAELFMSHNLFDTGDDGEEHNEEVVLEEDRRLAELATLTIQTSL